MIAPPRSRWRPVTAALTLVAATSFCSDAGSSEPAEPEVSEIVLSVSDTALRFRDRLIVRATPQGALGVPLARPVTWTSLSPSVLAVETIGANGDSVRLRPTGIGTAQVQASSGGTSRSLQVTVQDTVFSVTVTPTGPFNLIAGDTITFRATVTGPPAAETQVAWDVSNPAILQRLASPDELAWHGRVIAAGTVSLRATAAADTTKSATTGISAQLGRLVFTSVPTSTPREIPFAPDITVSVLDPFGQVSRRATNTVSLLATPGACSTTIGGHAVVTAAQGVATFPRLAMTSRCASVALTATASPPAQQVTSPAFSVEARHCASAAPLALGDSLGALMEPDDCTVTRNGATFRSHTYVLAVPAGPNVIARLNAGSSADPRVEAVLSADDTSGFWADTGRTSEAYITTYVLKPGTYRFRAMTPAAANAQNYWLSMLPPLSATAPPCRVVTTLDTQITAFGRCSYAFKSKLGEAMAGAFVVYQPPGKGVIVTSVATEPSGDPYLELLDLATPSSPLLVGFDDNSGGGVAGRDARVILAPVSTGRFVEIRAFIVGPGATGYTLVISQ